MNLMLNKEPRYTLLVCSDWFFLKALIKIIE